MPVQVKQGRHVTIPRPVRTSQPPIEARRFATFDPGAAPPEPPPRRPYAAVALALAAPVVAAIPIHAPLRFAIAILLLVAAALVVRSGRAAGRRTSTALPAPTRAVSIDAERLVFEGHEPHTLLALDEPFGVTLLATPRRDRVVAMLSSSLGTYYLGASLDDADRASFVAHMNRALTVAADDVGLESIGPDGEPLLFAPTDLAAIVDALVEQNPACLERFVLTDARGAVLALDGRHLAIGERSLDLTAPLEWRPILFQESFGAAIAIYQGTWVRQGGTEVVLVSLLPALGPPPGADLDLETLDRSVLRDLRLMQALPAEPPPAEQRVAIDRLFMLPVRSALDAAPRASHLPNRARA